MPNYISLYDDWYPLSDDPKKAAAQAANLKQLAATSSPSFATVQTTITNEDAATSAKFLASSHYKRKKEGG